MTCIHQVSEHDHPLLLANRRIRSKNRRTAQPAARPAAHPPFSAASTPQITPTAPATNPASTSCKASMCARMICAARKTVEGPNGYEPSTSIKDGRTIVAFALPEEFPSVEAVEHFVEADSPQAAMDKLVSFLQDLGFRGEVRVTDYSDTAVYFTAEISSDEPIIVPYNTNYEDADDIIGA